MARPAPAEPSCLAERETREEPMAAQSPAAALRRRLAAWVWLEAASWAAPVRKPAASRAAALVPSLRAALAERELAEGRAARGVPAAIRLAVPVV